ncbi:extracellular calcium-sensing receptor-like [Protopterus annectens]|uniref:extracellular calcium-sensing receptor-like n=1 Tax=Protopterus annectens TaxID=7888 RepID=UPI001CFA3E84|nr:extracellular calcium-sensing receptor-like [Protopterus annectens]
MGSPCGTSLANTVMAYWEDQYLFKNAEWAPYIKYYTRFLDDIFILFEGDKNIGVKFLHYLNNTTEFFRFTSNFQNDSIDYLDVNLSKDYVNKQYFSKIHRKTTFCNSYLHYTSLHPTSQKKGIVKGQLIRAARMTTYFSDFELECNLLTDFFCERGYPCDFVDEIVQEVRYKRINGTILPILNQTSDRGAEVTFKANQDILLEEVDMELLHYLRKVSFINSNNEEIFFDKNGDPPALYDILNWQISLEGSIQLIEIGRFDSKDSQGHYLQINTSKIIWNGYYNQIPPSRCSEDCIPGYRKAVQQGQPICCFVCILCSEGEISNNSGSSECFKCPLEKWPNKRQDKCLQKSTEFLTFGEPLGIILAIAVAVSALASIAVLLIIVKCRDTPVVKANNRDLSYLLLLSMTLCLLCSLIFLGEPSQVTCTIRQVTFGMTFVLSVSCVLAKTIMVIIAFNATNPNSNVRKWIGPKLPYVAVSVCILFQLLISVTWLSIFPPFPEKNMSANPGLIVVECNEGSATAFWCMLGYVGILNFISFVVAFLSRNLPDSFNEAKYITFSTFVSVSVWLSFVPAYLSTKGKYMVAVEVFAILSSNISLLTCIFLPKLYIIVLKPYMNTKEYLMKKHRV